MPKPLSEMTPEELWQLFPILLRDHNPPLVREHMSAARTMFGPRYAVTDTADCQTALQA